MSSIFGFVSTAGIEQSAEILRRMGHAIPADWTPIDQTWMSISGQAAVACCRRVKDSGGGQLAMNQAKGLVCCYEGSIYDAPLRMGQTVAEFLLEAYDQHGPECVADLNGNFNVAWWSEVDRTLEVANDKMGFRFLYYGEQCGALAFSSHLPRVVASGLTTREIDAASLADLLALIMLPGDRTLIRDVHVLPPASVLTMRNGTVKTRRYWRLDSVEQKGGYDRSRLDELEALMRDAVRRCTEDAHDLALGVTGGIDSRCIAAACSAENVPFVGVTEGKYDSTDVRIGGQVSRLLGQRYEFYPAELERLAEWLEPMVMLEGGLMPSFVLQPCRQVFQPSPYDRIALGSFGETARCYFLSPGDLRDPQAAARAAFRRRSFSKTARSMDLSALAQPGFRKTLCEAPEGHLREIVDGYSWQESPLDAADYYYFQELGRKAFNTGPLVADVGVEHALPYLDHDWVSGIFSIPPSARLGNRIRFDLIRRFVPGLAKVPLDKSLPSTSAQVESMAHLAQRLKKRARLYKPVVKAPSLEPVVWSRGPLRPALTELLYSERAAFREYLLWPRVQPLLDSHFEGKADHLDLVAALTVFETAHRLWIRGVVPRVVHGPASSAARRRIVTAA